MNYYILTYQTIPDYLTARERFRANHLASVQKYFENGKLLLGGTLEPPYQEAVLVFQTNTLEEVQAFVDADPYVQNGLVSSYTIKKWNVAIGNL